MQVGVDPTAVIQIISYSGVTLPDDEEIADLGGDTMPGITGGIWGTDDNDNRIISFEGIPTTSGTFKVTITVDEVTTQISVAVLPEEVKYMEAFCDDSLQVDKEPTAVIKVFSYGGLILPDDEEIADLSGDTIPGITGGVWGTDNNGNRMISFVGTPTEAGTYTITITVDIVSVTTSVTVIQTDPYESNSYAVIKNKIVYFDSVNTPIDNFCNEDREIVTINNTVYQKIDISTLVFGEEFNHVNRLDDYFIYAFNGLITIDLTGLKNVTEIGNFVLYAPSKLMSIDLSPLVKLTSVGNFFLRFSDRLKSVNLENWTNVTTIGKYFLSGELVLQSVDISPLVSLKSISVGWFCYDESLSSLIVGDVMYDCLLTNGDFAKNVMSKGLITANSTDIANSWGIGGFSDWDISVPDAK